MQGKRPVFDRFGEKLRTLRKRHQLTLTQLAEALGYTAHSNSYLSLIEQSVTVGVTEWEIPRFL